MRWRLHACDPKDSLNPRVFSLQQKTSPELHEAVGQPQKEWHNSADNGNMNRMAGTAEVNVGFKSDLSLIPAGSSISLSLPPTHERLSQQSQQSQPAKPTGLLKQELLKHLETSSGPLHSGLQSCGIIEEAKPEPRQSATRILPHSLQPWDLDVAKERGVTFPAVLSQERLCVQVSGVSFWQKQPAFF